MNCFVDDVLIRRLVFAMFFTLAGCDSKQRENPTTDPVSVETSELQEGSRHGSRDHEADASLSNENVADSTPLIQQAVTLANQSLPGYEWIDNTHLPLSAVAPEIDELDVMDLILKFEDHYETDVTMEDIIALIGRENIDEARHYLTLDSITLLVAPW
jgi:hypothetical protein